MRKMQCTHTDTSAAFHLICSALKAYHPLRRRQPASFPALHEGMSIHQLTILLRHDLHHQAKEVQVEPALRDFAIFNAHNTHLRKLHAFLRGRNAKKGSLMSSTLGHAPKDAIALGHYEINRDL